MLSVRDSSKEVRRRRVSLELRNAAADARNVAAASELDAQGVVLEAKARVRNAGVQPGVVRRRPLVMLTDRTSPASTHLREAQRALAALGLCTTAMGDGKTGSAREETIPVEVLPPGTRTAVEAESELRKQAHDLAAGADLERLGLAQSSKLEAEAARAAEGLLRMREAAVARREEAAAAMLAHSRAELERVREIEQRAARREERIESLLHEMLATAPATQPVPETQQHTEKQHPSQEAPTKTGEGEAGRGTDTDEAPSGDSSEDEWLLSRVLEVASDGDGRGDRALASVMLRMARRTGKGETAAAKAEEAAGMVLKDGGRQKFRRARAQRRERLCCCRAGRCCGCGGRVLPGEVLDRERDAVTRSHAQLLVATDPNTTAAAQHWWQQQQFNAAAPHTTSVPGQPAPFQPASVLGQPAPFQPASVPAQPAPLQPTAGAPAPV
eukprot:Hpha_TRINITY_DN11746_c0_g1::TRINITY_DN11746_c0_g1_i1::g.31953::m.31953